MERKSQLVYTETVINKIRETDPNLEFMTNQWEKMYGERVTMTIDKYGNLVVEPLEKSLLKEMPDKNMLDKFIGGVIGEHEVTVIFNTEKGKLEWI